MKFTKLKSLLLGAMFLLTSSPLFAVPDSFAPIIQKVQDKVVHISTTSKVKIARDPFIERFFNQPAQPRKRQGLGSGIIYSKDGYIITNNHVIEGANNIEVTLHSGQKYTAKVIGTDKQTDLALLKITAKNLQAITLGDSNKALVGDWVIAIGNPMGLDHSVTVGILSAKGRDIFDGTAYGQFLQTDAAINPGNSGGPLFDVQGKVIGINTAIARGQGLGFAIPINLTKKVILQLLQGGSVKRGWLGVGIQPITEDLAESFGLNKNQKGVILTMIGPSSPAKKAGLKQGDVLLKANGKILKRATDLQQAVAETSPGGKIKFLLSREGTKLNKTVKVGLRPQDASEQVAPQQSDHNYGMQLLEIHPNNGFSPHTAAKQGLFVERINPSSLAYEKGIRHRDVLVKINNKDLKTIQQFQKKIKELRKRKKHTFSLMVQRGAKTFYLALPLEH